MVKYKCITKTFKPEEVEIEPGDIVIDVEPIRALSPEGEVTGHLKVTVLRPES